MFSTRFRLHVPRSAVGPLTLLLMLAALVAASFGERVRAQAPSNVLVEPSRYQDLKWRNVGPHRGGRVTAVSGVRTQPNVFYMGATGGGVWKTEDYGINWTPITDGQISTGSIGAIAVADSNPNVVYVGTGSQAIRSNVILGQGVYKSVDAGKTWQFIGLKEVGQIGSLRVHPKNPDLVYVAALGSPFGRGAERGVYRTRDGGTRWDKVLFVNDQTGVVSLAMNWSNPDEIYAGAWRAERKGWTIISGGPAESGGIYKTVDGGDHWTHLTSGLPAKLIGKIWLDIAQSKPNVVYAMIEAPGAEGGLYRSDDSGATWSLASNDARLRARPFYFNYVFVNPKHEDEVWVNELRLHRSTDAGKTWTAIETPHGDNQGMWFNPDNPDILIECNDGGANVSQNGGKSWSTILNQSTAEIYMVDTDQQFPYRIYGPQQDNSTVVVASLPPFAWPSDEPTQTWSQASGCESGQVRPRPDGKIIYGDCKGEFGRYNVETGQEQHYWIYPQQRYGLNPKDQTYRFVRQAPIEVDPHNPAIVYHGSQYVHKTTDGGLHWQKISPDVTANAPDKQTDSGEPITRDMTGEEVYSALYAMRASRLEPGVLWTGSNDGPVWVTRDGGKNWKNVTPTALPPDGRVHTIEDSPHRRGSAYVSVYRIYMNDFKPYLYMTNDYGATWTLLTDGTNGIPADQPMHVVREDPQVPGLLYAGTWYGIFVSFDQGKHWQPLQQNLPATPVTDIKVHDNDLVISTMGRGFWIMDDVTPLRQMAAGLAAPAASAASASMPSASVPSGAGDMKSTFLFAPAPAYRTHYVAQAGDPDKPEYPPMGVHIDYNLASAPAGEVKLEILDAAGHPVRTFTSEAARREGGDARAQAPRGRRGGGATTLPKKAGLNRFVWDLRYPGTWDANTPEGGPGGPLAAPGTYTAKLTADGVTQTRTFVVKIDPRVARDGVTPADLVEQLNFSLKVRDASSAANKLAARLKKALDAKSGDEAALRRLYDQLVNKPGPYTENMLIAQFQNVAREIGQADQKIGESAYERYNELMKALSALTSQVDQAAPQTLQPGGMPPPPAAPNPNAAANAAATAADHQNMMAQLGITKLRPGYSGNEQDPNHANYDEALANPYPDLPDALTLKNGKKVTSADMWWKQRRPEIVEDFEREVVGRVPKAVPAVTWTIKRTEHFSVGGREVIGKELIGRVDNRAYPDITVEIQMTLVTPANATKPVPVMMMFGGRSGMPPAPGAPPPAAPSFTPPPSPDPPATEQLIAAGWGYASILPGSIQPDNGAGLTKGIIGLVNKGQPRKPDDWGALRAWAWGAGRGLDYLGTDKTVDAKKVGIEGVSRFGKAALVTMAYDQRFAVVLIGSSGEGGTKLHRRNWGEAVENLTGSGGYHWMAGNFLKYGAEESTFGRKTAADLPVDAHELLALCAPRPTFISHGIPERGDAKWLDHQGSYMAAVASQPVFRLLGAKGLGVSDDYKTEKMPAVNVSLLDGQLAWRQHDGGHTDGPNWKYFIPWADKLLKHAR